MHVRKLPFIFELAHDRHGDLRPFAVLQPMLVVV
jgi:hypothetical protein